MTTPLNYVIEWMKQNDVPLTKENYLEISYLGDIPDEEAEENLPLIFQEVLDK